MGGGGRRIGLWLLLVAAAGGVGALRAQSAPPIPGAEAPPPGREGEAQGPPEVAAAARAQAEPEPAEAPLPVGSEAVPRLLALEQEAEEVRRALADLRQGTGASAQVDAAAGRLAEVRTQLAALSEVHLDGDRLLHLRTRARRERDRLEELLAANSEQYRELEQLAERWDGHRRFFARWQEALRRDPTFASVAADLTAARRRIAALQEEIAAAAPTALGAQQRVQALLQESRRALVRIDALLGEWKTRLLRRSGPVLLTPAFWGALRADLGAPLREGLARARLDGAYLAERAPAVGLQLLLLVAIALVARRLRHAPGADEAWRGLLSHPWALGTFTAVAAFASLFELAPGAWRLASALALAGSLCVLAAGTFPRRRHRRAAYLLAALYVAFRAAEALGLPETLFRLLLTGLCLASLPFVLGLAAREIRERGRLTELGALLRLCAAVLAVVALADAAGYSTLAAWVFEAALRTVFLAFAATFLIRLGRRLFHVGLRWQLAERSPLLHRVGERLAHRLAWVFKVVVMAGALLWAAEVWNLAASPLAAWRAVTGFRLGFGDTRLTVGHLLLAAAALYVSMVLSWLLRAVLDEEVIARHSLERGVGDSIKTLLHYSVIVVGLLLALSLAGLDLSTFAFVAGALGVGIGFGLQNVVNNFLSGIILLFERPVRVGDTVVLGSESGVVRRIGLRSTVVQTGDRAEVIVPNSKLIAETVVNWTLSNRMARLALPVGVAYGSDLGRVQAILEEAAREHAKLLAEPPAHAVLTGFGDNAINFELRVWVADVEDRPRVQSQLLRAVAERLAAAGIELPFPQRDLHLRSVDEEAARRLGAGRALPAAAAGEAPERPPQ